MSLLADRFDNFNNAVKRLNEANIAYKKNGKDSLIQDSLIKRFEFTFELAWKTLRDFLTAQGYVINVASPRNIIALAFQEGYLSDEKIWLDMLEARNQTAHDYNRAHAEEVADNISNSYCKALQNLCKFIAGNLK